MTGAEVMDKIQDHASDLACRIVGIKLVTARIGSEAYVALLAHCDNTVRYEAKEPTFAMVRDCVCGHPPGHHDDEPHGCWDCACEAWQENEAQEPRRVEIERSPSPIVSLRIHTNAGEVGVQPSARLVDVVVLVDSRGEAWPSE